MDAQRKEAIEKLERLKQGFTQKPPDITVAFDLAEAALLVAVNGGGNEKLSARDITKQMFSAVMNAGFMIMHRDEIENTILAAAQAGKILKGLPGSTETVK